MTHQEFLDKFFSGDGDEFMNNMSADDGYELFETGAITCTFEDASGNACPVVISLNFEEQNDPEEQ